MPVPIPASTKAAKEKRRTEQEDLARQIRAEKRRAKEAEAEAVQLRLEERRMEEEELRLQRETLRALKVKEMAMNKEAAKAELQAAIERVERAREVESMVDADPAYEIPDDMSVASSIAGSSVRSGQSTRSMKERLGRKLKKAKEARIERKVAKIVRDLNLDPTRPDARDDGADGPRASREDRVDKKPRKSSNGGGPNRASLNLTRAKSTNGAGRAKSSNGAKSTKHRPSLKKSAARDEEPRPSRVREQTIVEDRERTEFEEDAGVPGGGGQLQAWLEWFMGDPQGCDGDSSCGSSY